MKKYISLLSFIAIFFIGMDQSQAQDARARELASPEGMAKQQTHELHKMANLTGDQQSGVFKVFVDLNQNLNALEGNGDITAVQKSKATLVDNAKGKLKMILNPEQYAIYLKSLEKQPKE